MKKAIGKIMYGLGFLIGVALFIIGFLAYFITSSRNGVIIDGLGRPLSESPLLIRIIFGQDRLWAGFGWFILELLIFWCGVGLIYLFISNGFKLLEEKK
jgi:TM2 domain-containing membrane protein YozV